PRPPTHTYPLSLHDALPISPGPRRDDVPAATAVHGAGQPAQPAALPRPYAPGVRPGTVAASRARQPARSRRALRRTRRRTRLGQGAVDRRAAATGIRARAAAPAALRDARRGDQRARRRQRGDPLPGARDDVDNAGQRESSRCIAALPRPGAGADRRRQLAAAPGRRLSVQIWRLAAACFPAGAADRLAGARETQFRLPNSPVIQLLTKCHRIDSALISFARPTGAGSGARAAPASAACPGAASADACATPPGAPAAATPVAGSAEADARKLSANCPRI